MEMMREVFFFICILCYSVIITLILSVCPLPTVVRINDFHQTQVKTRALSVLQVNFEDVFAEPDGIRSVDCLWTWSYKIYTCSKKYSYISLSCIFGFLFALIWGFLFAFLSFWHIWVIVPCVTACRVVFGCLIHPLIRIIKLFFFMPFKGLEKVLRITIEILRKRA